jgi:cytoskeletal protein CcmA (bactofilin family)
MKSTLNVSKAAIMSSTLEVSGDILVNSLTVGKGTGIGNTAVGYQALYDNTDGSYNVAIGNTSLRKNETGYNNTAVGPKSLYSNTTGHGNTAVGYETLYSNKTGVLNTAIGNRVLVSNTTGANNTATGHASLLFNTTGGQNCGYGYATLHNNTVGTHNVAMGFQTLYSNTVGNYNTGTGNSALLNNINGTHNVANGASALSSNTSGSFNAAVGFQSLLRNTSTSENTAIGHRAGWDVSNSSASQNTFIGAQTGFDVSINDYTYSTALGYGASINDHNQIMLGRSQETVEVPGMLNVSKAATLKSTLNVSKAATMASTLAVTGKTTLHNDVSMNSNVDISGDLVINGNLSVNQQQNTSVINTTVNDYQLIVTEDLSLNGKLSASGDVSLNADVDISGNLEVKNFTYFNNHVYPTTDDAIDIGSPDFKIRDLYLSTSSLWLGDDHKIDVSGGEMKFRKRKTSRMPKVFSNRTIGDVRTALSLDESVGISDIKLGQWLQYARTIDGGVNGKTGRQLSVQDIFGKDADDYENIQDAAVGESDLSLNHDLKVGGQATFHKRVDICGNFYAQYPPGSIPASAITGSISTTTSTSESTAISQTLDVSGATSLDSSLDVSGSATFNSTLAVNGDVSFNSTANVDVCGNFYAQYPAGSIPASAISGTISSSSVNANNQTFFDILTQQPGKFTFDSSSNTTANLTINWNYDDIKAKISGTEYQALLNFQTSSATKNLPYMSALKIDISSANATQSGWIPYENVSLANADYNDSSYKTLTITKNTGSDTAYADVLSSLDPFDVRVYGINNSYNYPDEATRALIFTVFFKTPKPPSDPDFVSKAINSYQQSTLTYTFTEPEQGDTDSLGKLNASQTKYQENETLSSTAYAVSTTINTKTETYDNDNVSGGNNFTVVLSSLRAGTKYNFITRVNNDLIDTYSIEDTDWGNVGTSVDFDTTNGPTAFTSLPGNGSYSSAYTPTLGYNNTTYVTTSSFTNSNIIYINTADSQTVVPSNNSNQTFQITDQSATTSSTKGFGKYVDNVNNLVQVKASVNDTVKQTLSYQGFTPSATTKYGSATRSTHNLNYFDTPSQNDIYSDTLRKGYRLYGIFKLLTLSNDNVETYIGGASSTPYSLKLEYIRDSDKVGGTASTTTTSSIYVDTLSENPSATSSNTAVVTSVAWNMGIPSVKKYKIDATRTYSNINSSYGYIRGDRKLSTFSGVTASANTSPFNTFTSQTILLSRSSISNNGSYVYDTYADLATANNGVLNNLYYNDTRDITDTSLTISETLYSLKSDGTTYNTEATVEHYFDRSSYNGFGSNLSNKLSLSNGSIYQLDSISSLGNDLASITVSEYTSHETIPESHTLLYIGGKFQTGGYPDVTSYQWNDVTGSFTYNTGSTGVTTGGTSATTGTRYKWIAFKLNKNSSTQYSFNGSNYTIKTNGDNYKYLSVKDMFVTSGLFDSTTISNLFDSSSTAAIGFCRATKSGTSTNVYGYFKNDFDTTQTWSSVGTGAGAYSSLTAAKYGCKVEHTNGDYGIQISSTALNNDLHVFIGLKI